MRVIYITVANCSWYRRFTWQPTWHVSASIERLPCCILKFISYCQNTNKSDNCSMQDSRPRPRHITARLRKRSPVWHLRPPLAPPWDGAALGGQSSAAAQARWPAKHDGRIETIALVAREVSHRVQDTRHCVSRPTRADAGVHCLADHTVRAASRPAICRPRVASGSSAQPRTLWTPLILSCRTNSLERTTWGLAFYSVHEQV